jgi:hypothetical protein
MAFMTATVFFRTTLSPDNIADGSLYLSMIFFSLVHIMFNSYAEMSLTVSLARLRPLIPWELEW